MGPSRPSPARCREPTGSTYEISSPEGSSKLWREDRYGLLVKLVMTPKGHAPAEVFEIEDFKIGKPDASVFTVPSRCKWPDP